METESCLQRLPARTNDEEGCIEICQQLEMMQLKVRDGILSQNWHKPQRSCLLSLKAESLGLQEQLTGLHCCDIWPLHAGACAQEWLEAPLDGWGQ